MYYFLALVKTIDEQRRWQRREEKPNHTLICQWTESIVYLWHSTEYYFISLIKNWWQMNKQYGILLYAEAEEKTSAITQK